jgi:site-specific recombinase XerC
MSTTLVPLLYSDAESGWSRLKDLVLDSVSAESSKRLYAMALDAFCSWYFAEPHEAFSKAVVQQYRTVLERRGYASSTISLHLSALRKLAMEGADNGLLDSQIAAGISRIKGPRRLGRRVGRWLSASQAAALIKAPNCGTLKGARDQAILAVAIGCGLRRSEIAALSIEHLQIVEDRWIIADLVGKHRRIRSIPIPAWTKSRLDLWLNRAMIMAGQVFRAINKADTIMGSRMTSQAIYEVINTCGARISLAVAPHDLRRTFAKLAYEGEASLEQIQYSLGHGSLLTTELYLGLQQDLVNAAGDRISLPL